MLFMCAYPSNKPMLKDVNWNPTSAKFETLTCHVTCGKMELNPGIFCYLQMSTCVHVCVIMKYGYLHIKKTCACLSEYLLCVAGPFLITLNWAATFSQLLLLLILLQLNNTDYVTYQFLELTFWKTGMFKADRFNGPWIYSTNNTAVAQYMLHQEWQFSFHSISLSYDQITKSDLNVTDNFVDLIPQPSS